MINAKNVLIVQLTEKFSHLYDKNAPEYKKKVSF